MNKKNLFKKIALCTALSLCTISLSACLTSTDGGEPFSYNVANLQTVIKNDTNENGLILEDFAKQTADNLVDIYGFKTKNGDLYPINKYLTSATPMTTISLWDTIIGQTFYTNVDTTYAIEYSATPWLWSANLEHSILRDDASLYGKRLTNKTETAKITKWVDDIGSMYLTNQTSYETFYTNYKNSIKEPLQIVIYSLSLSKQIPAFTLISKNDGNVSFNIGSQTSKDYLTKLKEEYKTQSTYIGLTTNNISDFKNYIINSVIGTNSYTLQNKSSINSVAVAEPISRLYNNIIDNILNGLVKELKIDAYLNSTIKTTTDFSNHLQGFIDKDIAEKTPYNVQSIIVNPSTTGNLKTIVYTIAGTENFDLDVYINYYDIATKTKTSFKKTFKVTITDSAKYMEIANLKELGLSTIPLSPIKTEFDNSIFNNIDKQIDRDSSGHNKSLADYYTLKNINGGIRPEINTELLSTDFCETGFIEISFVSTTNLPFSFGLFSFVVE